MVLVPKQVYNIPILYNNLIVVHVFRRSKVEEIVGVVNVTDDDAYRAAAATAREEFLCCVHGIP